MAPFISEILIFELYTGYDLKISRLNLSYKVNNIQHSDTVMQLMHNSDKFT